MIKKSFAVPSKTKDRLGFLELSVSISLIQLLTFHLLLGEFDDPATIPILSGFLSTLPTLAVRDQSFPSNQNAWPFPPRPRFDELDWLGL